MRALVRARVRTRTDAAAGCVRAEECKTASAAVGCAGGKTNLCWVAIVWCSLWKQSRGVAARIWLRD